MNYLFDVRRNRMYKWMPPVGNDQHIYYELSFADHSDKVITKYNQPFDVSNENSDKSRISIMFAELSLAENKIDVTAFVDTYKCSFKGESFTVFEIAALCFTLLKRMPFSSIASHASTCLTVVNGDTLDETVYKDTDIIVI